MAKNEDLRPKNGEKKIVEKGEKEALAVQFFLLDIKIKSANDLTAMEMICPNLPVFSPPEVPTSEIINSFH